MKCSGSPAIEPRIDTIESAPDVGEVSVRRTMAPGAGLVGATASRADCAASAPGRRVQSATAVLPSLTNGPCIRDVALKLTYDTAASNGGSPDAFSALSCNRHSSDVLRLYWVPLIRRALEGRGGAARMGGCDRRHSGVRPRDHGDGSLCSHIGQVTKDAHDTAYRTYRVLIHVIIGLLVVFFLLGNRIAWHIALVGLAWRAWLLLYTLPAWYTALRDQPANGDR